MLPFSPSASPPSLSPSTQASAPGIVQNLPLPRSPRAPVSLNPAVRSQSLSGSAPSAPLTQGITRPASGTRRTLSGFPSCFSGHRCSGSSLGTSPSACLLSSPSLLMSSQGPRRSLRRRLPGLKLSHDLQHCPLDVASRRLTTHLKLNLLRTRTRIFSPGQPSHDCPDLTSCCSHQSPRATSGPPLPLQAHCNPSVSPAGSAFCCICEPLLPAPLSPTTGQAHGAPAVALGQPSYVPAQLKTPSGPHPTTGEAKTFLSIFSDHVPVFSLLFTPVHPWWLILWASLTGPMGVGPESWSCMILSVSGRVLLGRRLTSGSDDRVKPTALPGPLKTGIEQTDSGKIPSLPGCLWTGMSVFSCLQTWPILAVLALLIANCRSWDCPASKTA